MNEEEKFDLKDISSKRRKVLKRNYTETNKSKT